ISAPTRNLTLKCLKRRKGRQKVLIRNGGRCNHERMRWRTHQHARKIHFKRSGSPQKRSLLANQFVFPDTFKQVRNPWVEASRRPAIRSTSKHPGGVPTDSNQGKLRA